MRSRVVLVLTSLFQQVHRPRAVGEEPAKSVQALSALLGREESEALGRVVAVVVQANITIRDQADKAASVMLCYPGGEG